MSDYVEYDAKDASAEPLPDWGALPDGVIALRERGVVIREAGDTVSAVPWEQVLGILEHRGYTYVLAPRTPPHQPWYTLELDAADHNDLLETWKQRSLAQDYRSTVVRHESLPKVDFVRRVMGREHVPGLVEIGFKKKPFDWIPAAIVMTLPAISLASMGGPNHAFVGAMAGAALGASVASVVYWLHKRIQKRDKRRILALAPSGCVCGFVGRVEGFDWSEVHRFSAAGGDLVVHSETGELGRIGKQWLPMDADFIAKVANTFDEYFRPRTARTEPDEEEEVVQVEASRTHA